MTKVTVSLPHLMKNGSKATCIAYHGVNNITVEFEDGFVLYHARWNHAENRQQITGWAAFLFVKIRN